MGDCIEEQNKKKDCHGKAGYAINAMTKVSSPQLKRKLRRPVAFYNCKQEASLSSYQQHDGYQLKKTVVLAANFDALVLRDYGFLARVWVSQCGPKIHVDRGRICKMLCAMARSLVRIEVTIERDPSNHDEVVGGFLAIFEGSPCFNIPIMKLTDTHRDAMFSLIRNDQFQCMERIAFQHSEFYSGFVMDRIVGGRINRPLLMERFALELLDTADPENYETCKAIILTSIPYDKDNISEMEKLCNTISKVNL